jgi:AraC-like DNA-binding protein
MKTKSILVVLVTLIIGFILGMLTSAQIRYHRLKPVRVFFSEERFRDGFYKTIQPDEQQKAKIDLVLNKFAKINSELQNNFRKELDVNMKEFRKELDLNLTKEQLARLKEMDDRRQEMIRQNRKNRQNDTLNSRDERRHYPGRRLEPDGTPPFPDHDSTKLPDNK